MSDSGGTSNEVIRVFDDKYELMLRAKGLLRSLSII